MELLRESYVLTELEIIFLASLTGGERFPGIDMEIEKDQVAEWRASMDVQRRSLERRGLLEIDFDGTAKLNKTLREFINIASTCETYYCQLNHVDGQLTHKNNYFVLDAIYYVMSYSFDKNEYTISPLFGFYEFQVQLIDRLSVMNRESTVNTGLQGGNATIASTISEFHVLSSSLAITRELSIIKMENQLWKHDNDEDKLLPMTYGEAMDQICQWIKKR